jgi:hypothetical protein
VRAAVHAHHRDRPVSLEPHHSRDVRPEQHHDLVGECVEQRSRLDSARDEHRNTPQRRMLDGETNVVPNRLSHANSLNRSHDCEKGGYFSG